MSRMSDKTSIQKAGWDGNMGSAASCLGLNMLPSYLFCDFGTSYIHEVVRSEYVRHVRFIPVDFNVFVTG